MSMIDTLRQLYPHYDQYSDEELLAVFSDAAPSTSTPSPDNEEEPGLVSDLASSWGVGSNLLLKGVGTLYGYASGDMDNWARRQGQSGVEYWQKDKSQSLIEKEQARERAVAEQDGFFAEFGTAVWETVKDPELFVNTLAQTAPSMVPGAAAARGAALLGAGTTAVTGTTLGTTATIQGASVGDEAYRALKDLPDYYWSVNSDYVELVESGVSPEEAREKLSQDYSKAAALKSGGVSLASQMVPGGATVDRFLAGTGSKTAGRFAGAGKGLLGESLQEGVEEGTGQYFGNVAEQEVNQPLDPMKGVGGAAGLGVAAGGPMGAAAGFFSPVQDPDAEDPLLKQREKAYMDRIDAANERIRQREQAVYEATQDVLKAQVAGAQQTEAEINILSTPNPTAPEALDDTRLANVIDRLTGVQSEREAALSGGGLLSDPVLRKNYIEDADRLEKFVAEASRRGLFDEVNNLTEEVNNLTEDDKPALTEGPLAKPRDESQQRSPFVDYPDETLPKVIGTVSWNVSEMERQLRRNNPDLDRPKVQAEYRQGVAELEALIAEADRRGVPYELKQSYLAEQQANKPQVQEPAQEPIQSTEQSLEEQLEAFEDATPPENLGQPTQETPVEQPQTPVEETTLDKLQSKSFGGIKVDYVTDDRPDTLLNFGEPVDRQFLHAPGVKDSELAEFLAEKGIKTKPIAGNLSPYGLVVIEGDLNQIPDLGIRVYDGGVKPRAKADADAINNRSYTLPEVDDSRPGNKQKADRTAVPRSKPEPKADATPEAPEQETKVEVSKNTVFTEDAAEKARELLRKKLGQLNSGIDPEVMAAGITLAGYHIEKGARTFAAYAKAMVADMGEGVKPYLKSWYAGVKYDPRAAGFADEMDGIDSLDVDEALSGDETSQSNEAENNSNLLEDEQVTGTPQDGGTEVTVEEATESTPENETQSDVYDVAMLNAIKDNMEEITSNNKLKKVIADQKGIKPSEVDANMVKEGQEIYEYLLVYYARKHDQSASGGITFLKPFFDNLVTEYNQQPNLNVRTSTSMANQAYSTPRPMAWIAQRLAGVNSQTDVYEPTAGMGMLTTKAQPANIMANELNDLRAELLRRDLSYVTQNDATTYVPVTKADVVITNPPFGPLKGGPVKVDGYTIKKLDHLIAANALKAMKDNGRAVLIIGANKEAGEIGSGADRVFFNWLYSHYNVVDHFEVSGDLYARQGAGWPVRIITIQGRQQSDKIGPQSGTIDRLNSWEELYERHTQTLDAIKSGTGSETSTDGAGRPEANESNESGSQNDQQDSAPDREITEPGLSDESTGSDSRDDGERPSGPSVSDNNVGDTERSDGAGRPEGETSETTGRGEGVSRTDTGNVGGRSDKQSGRVSEASGSDFQTNYTTLSGGPNDKVLTPAGMGEASLSALKNIQEAVGNIDQYVQQKLGYESVEDMYGMYMGLQIDTIAAAIYNYEERDRGIIIADQTGVGKGRQAAGILRYAKRIGKIPVFVTVKPNLFTDMYEELQATGSDPSPLIINTDGVIKDGDQVLVRNTAGKHKKALQKIVETGQLPEGTDMVFLTYSQLNVENLQRDVIRALKGKAFFVLDESHNVAGERVRITKKKGKTTTGAGFMFQMLEDTPVTYLSATYAKRPDNMPVYFRTDISMAVDSLEELVDAVKNGGEPLQTALASMLSESGQLWRRERSFEGIEIKNHTITKGTEAQEKFSDQVTEGLRSIVAADKIFHAIQLEHANEAANAAGALFTGGAGNKASNSVDHHNFSSVAHNFINQLLLGVKVEATADLAIEAHKRGEKPVIALEHTMGSFLQQYVDETGAKVGDVIDLSYKDVLKRALERSRRLKYKAENGDEEVYQVPMDELLPEVREYYEEAEEIIDSLEIDDLPVSPIDYLRNRLEEAGISVAEVTGRSYTIDYSSGTPVLAKRETKEIKDRRGTIDGFNAGTIDALILNSAGATGLSIHASERFSDQKPRHMLVAQPMADINILMQMLGRINRTGQTVLPIYTMLGANIPAEKRPLARTAMKMKSLNANTSANTESDTSVDVPDILNKYGDVVVRSYLKEYPDLAEKVNIKVVTDETQSESEAEDLAGLATKFTGRLALLSIEEQRAAYEDIEAGYQSLIDYLDKVGQNDLNPKTLELDAKIEESAIVYEGKQPDTIFGGHTFLHKINSRYQGKPPTPEEARESIEKAPDATQEIERIINEKEDDLAYAESLDDRLRKRQDELDDFKAEKPDDPELLAKWGEKLDKLNAAVNNAKTDIESYNYYRQKTKDMLKTFRIGSHIRLSMAGENVTGIVTSVANSHKVGRGNPWVLSKTRIGMVLNNGMRYIDLPFTQLEPSKGIFKERLVNEGAVGLETIFELSNRISDRRETRYLATGNLVAGSANLTEGRIVNFTDSEGKIHKGILMPHNYKSSQFSAVRDSGNFPMRDLALVAKYLRTYHDRATVTSPNKAIHITAGRRPNTWSISLPKANKVPMVKAVKYDKDLMDAMGTEFAGSGARMAATFDDNRLDEVLEVLTRTVPLVGDKQQRKLWVDIGGDAAPEQVSGFDNGEVDLDGAKLSAKEGVSDPEAQKVKPAQLSDKMQLASDIAEAFGKTITWIKSKTIEGAAKGKAIYVNAGSGVPQHIVLGHELTHTLKTEAPDLYAQLERLILPRATQITGDTEEFIANVVGNRFGEKQFWADMAGADVNIFKRIARKVMAFLGDVVARLRKSPRYQGGDAVKNLNKVRGDIAKVMSNYAARTQGMTVQGFQAKYSPAKFGRTPENDVVDLDGAFGIPTQRIRDNILTTIHDKFKILKDIQTNIKKSGGKITDENDAYGAETLFHGETEEDLRELQDDHIRPLVEAMSKAGISKEDLDNFLYARHAGERNAAIAEINEEFPDGGSGMTDAEAEAILEDVAKSGKQKEYEALADRVYAMLAWKRQLLKDSGLAGDEQMERWEEKFEFYVPLKGTLVEHDNMGPKTGQGFHSARKNESQRAMGRSSRAESPLGMTLVDVTETIVRAQKNKVGNAFLQLVRDNPYDGYWNVYTEDHPDMRRIIKAFTDVNPLTGEASVEEYVDWGRVNMAMMANNYFVTKKGGKRFFIKLEDERLMNALKSVGVEQVNTLTRWMGNATRFMSSMNTAYNPEFMIANFVSDVQTALLNLQAEQDGADGRVVGEKVTKAAFKGIYQAGKAYWRIMHKKQGKTAEEKQWDEYAQRFLRAGGKTGYFDMKDLDGQIRELDKEFEIAEGTAKGQMLKRWRQGTDLVENLNGSIENAVRLSAFVAATKHAKLSDKQAAILAKDMTVNFNRRGTSGTLINSLFMFANASIQGTANFARTMFMFKPQLEGEAKIGWNRLTNAQKIAAGMAMGAFALAVLNRQMAGEDEDGVNWYDKVPGYEKERNIIFMKWDGSGEYYKLRLPYGYNAFKVFGDVMEAVTVGNRPVGEQVGQLAGAIATSFSPIGFETSQDAIGFTLKNLTPTVARPLTDLALNENFFGSTIYTENYSFGTPKPDSSLNRPPKGMIDEGVKGFAAWLNTATGGSKFRSGLIDFNGDAAMYLIRYPFGAMGKFWGDKLPDFLERWYDGRDIPVRKMPSISRLAGEVLPYEDTDTFYRNRDLIKQYDSELKSLKGTDKTEFFKENRGVLSLRNEVKAAEKRLKVLRQQRRAIYDNKDLSDLERDNRLEIVDGKIKKIIDKFNKQFREAN